MGDEFHYLFYCSHFTQARCRFLPQQLIDCPNTITYSTLMNCKDKSTVIGLAKFIKIQTLKRASTPQKRTVPFRARNEPYRARSVPYRARTVPYRAKRAR